MPKIKQESKEQELMRLRKENAELRKQSKKAVSKQKSSGKLLRNVAVILCLGTAIALFVLGSLLFWAGRTVTNTENYSKTIAPLVEQPEIQDALALRITTEIFQTYDVESLARESLPERAEFLAAPIASQVRTHTEATIKKILASDKFKDIWVNVNTRAHERLFTLIRSDSASDGVIDINEIYSRVSQELADSGLSFLANRELPEKIGTIKILESEKLKKAHWLVVNLPLLRILTVILAVVLLIGGILLSKNRRKAVVASFIIIAVLFVLLAISIRVAKLLVVDSAAIEYQAAVGATWRVIVSSLYVQLASSIVLALLIAFVAWMSGNGKVAKSARSRINDLLAGRLHESIFKSRDPRWVVRLRSHRKAITITLAVLSLLYLAVAPISFARIIIAVIISGLALLLLDVIAGRDKK